MDKEIDWSNQHCGVHQASYSDVVRYMPDLASILSTFPENLDDFVWDVKVHMLMPSQFPCIPNWHYDNVPRVNNKQDFDLINTSYPMYLWISNEPLTEFRSPSGVITKVQPKKWVKFSQKDEHRGVMSNDFQWRGFIRGTHKQIMPTRKRGESCLRRHSQVYLDANNFSW